MKNGWSNTGQLPVSFGLDIMTTSEDQPGVRPLQDGPEPDSVSAALGNAEAGSGVSEDAGRKEKDGAEEEVGADYSSSKTSENASASGLLPPFGKAITRLDCCIPEGSPYSISAPSRRNDIANVSSNPTTRISPPSSTELMLARISRMKNDPQITCKRSDSFSSRHLANIRSASHDSINCVPPEVDALIQSIYNGLVVPTPPSQSTSCK